MDTGLHHMQKKNEEKYYLNSKQAYSPLFPLPDEPFTWEYDMRREMQEIIPGVFLGPLAAATKRDKLQENGITHIICIRQEPEEAPFVKPLYPNEFQYLVLNIADSPTENLITHLNTASQFITKCIADGGKVLVHSNAAISRAPALVIGFVMENKQITSSDAMRLVQKKRFCIFPNEGFRTQLLEYEPIWKARLAGITCSANTAVSITGNLMDKILKFCEDTSPFVVGDAVRTKRSHCDEEYMEVVCKEQEAE